MTFLNAILQPVFQNGSVNDQARKLVIQIHQKVKRPSIDPFYFPLTNILICAGEEDVKADEEIDDLDAEDEIVEGKHILFPSIIIIHSNAFIHFTRLKSI